MIGHEWLEERFSSGKRMKEVVTSQDEVSK